MRHSTSVHLNKLLITADLLQTLLFHSTPTHWHHVHLVTDHYFSFQTQLPRIFHVNWFRTDESGQFLWPGFGQNIRVIDWILRRCKGEDIAVESPIGFVPKPGMD